MDLNNIDLAITTAKCMEIFEGLVPCFDLSYTLYLKSLDQNIILRKILMRYLDSPQIDQIVLEKILNTVDNVLVKNSAYTMIILKNSPFEISNFYLEKITNPDYKYLAELNLYIRSLIEPESNEKTPDENHIRNIIGAYRYHEHVEDIVQYILNKEFNKALEKVYSVYTDRLTSDEIA